MALYRYGAQSMDNTVLARFHIGKVRALLAEHQRIGTAIKVQPVAASAVDDGMPRQRSHADCGALRGVLPASRIACEEGPTTASLRLPFPKNSLARKLGLAPEALSCAFSTLKSAGVTVRGRFTAINYIISIH